MRWQAVVVMLVAFVAWAFVAPFVMHSLLSAVVWGFTVGILVGALGVWVDERVIDRERRKRLEALARYYGLRD